MRRVKLLVATSLDGYIAGPNEDVDWLFMDQDYGMSEFYRSIDTTLLGRKTFEFGERHGQVGYEGMHNYVFSRTPRPSEHAHVQWVTEDPATCVATLRQQSGKDIWLVGGGELFSHLARRQQVDDISIAVHPIILGEGISLYQGIQEHIGLTLTGIDRYDSGLVTLHYRVEHER
ncbi:MAG: dihydrofolate reductase family protein [Gemmatimonadota bacterium]|nr:dihydrofolate reductase family protein [Gemmatimonadota bacterium]